MLSSSPARSVEAIAALRNNDVDTVRELIERNKLRASMPLDDGNFPLSYAIAPGQKEMAQLLLDAGANVDTRFGKMNVLGWSIKNRDVELTRLLCERGAEVEGVLSDEGWTALGLAVSADNISEEILRLLLRFRCSPDLPFTVDGNTTTARELARSRKKQLAVAVFEDLVPTMQSAVVNEMAAEAPQKKSKKDKKDKGSVVEKRRPGSHWTMKDFNDLADLLLPFEAGTSHFSLHVLYDKLPQHGRITIQKHIQRAVAAVTGGPDKGAVAERLSSEQWALVIARIRQSGVEKSAARGTGAGAAVARRPRAAPVFTAPWEPRSAKPPRAAAAGVSLATARAAAPLEKPELPELGFAPLEGYRWFPGTDVLFASPQRVVHATVSAAALAAAPPPAPPRVSNDESRLMAIVKEIQTKRLVL